MLMVVNMMLCMGCLPDQPSHAFYNASASVFARALVNVIPYHILESV
jgi:hypothetical protein